MSTRIFLLASAILLYSCQKNMYQGSTEPDIIHKSKLFVDSNPKNLRIYLDSNYLGKNTPDTVNWLPDGSHKLSLMNDLYPDTTFDVLLKNDELKSIYVDGFSNPNFYNKIFVESDPPKAEIFLNDSATGKFTPYYWNRLLPANYKIKLKLPMHRADSVEVFVKKGEYKQFLFHLEDTTNYVTYKTSNSGIFSNYISSVAVDNNNVKWLGTLDKGIITFDGKKWNKIPVTNIFYAQQINKLLFDKMNNLWVFCSSGLLKYENSIWRNLNSQFGTDLINNLSMDDDGTINVSTRNGFYRFKDNTWSVIDSVNSCSKSNVMNTSFIADDGALWIGTDYYPLRILGDICKLNRPLDLPANISSNIVFIFEDYSQRMIFVHKALSMSNTRDAVTAKKGLEWIEITIPYVSPSQLNYVYKEKTGDYWFCTNSSVVRQSADGTIYNFNRTDSNIPIKQCTSIVKDLNGDYWISSAGSGLFRIKKTAEF